MNKSQKTNPNPAFLPHQEMHFNKIFIKHLN